MVGASPSTLRRLRGREIGFIFQDPATTLNPVLPVGRQIAEGQVAHGQIRGRRGARAARSSCCAPATSPIPARRAGQYPHQFSGGMRQRAVIAMALAGQPRLIIADEPTTALDVTVQAQVLAMLAQKQAESRAAALLITHDLGVVAETAHRVLVMYAGRIVESGPVERIFRRTAPPLHARPAAQHAAARWRAGAARPDPRPAADPVALPPGCAFQPRCADRPATGRSARRRTRRCCE